MGLNMKTKTPCGFCFVEYYTTEHACAALKSLNETMVDDRKIRCDKDTGFKPGRQYGRGISGGQVRDEKRVVQDALRSNNAPKASGAKRGSDGRSQQKKSSGKDEFGRDIVDDEARMADALIRMESDSGLSTSRREPQVHADTAGGEVEAADDNVQDDEPAPEVLDTADPRTMKDDRDGVFEINPSKRTRR